MKPFLQRILQEIGTSDAWSMSHLSQRTSEPAYYIVDCRIFGPLWITKLMIKAAKFPISYGWLWMSSVPKSRLLQVHNSFILPQASYINRTRLNLLLKSLRQRCCDSDLAKKRNLPSQTDCRDWRSTTAVRRLRPSSSNLSMSCFSIPQDLK